MKKIMENEKIITLIRTLIVIISYFIYTTCFFSIFKIYGGDQIYDNPIFSFLADLFYFFIIIIFYYKGLIIDFKKLKKDFKKNIITIFKWLGIAILCQMISIVILNNLLSKAPINDSALSELPLYYRIFKMMIFACIIEELVFRKSLYDVIENKKLFIIVSSLFYAIMNVVYYDAIDISNLASAIPYFTSSLVLSTLYVKTDNIAMTMTTKFIYQLISLTMMLVGA